jgi:hypothetical protein
MLGALSLHWRADVSGSGANIGIKIVAYDYLIVASIADKVETLQQSNTTSNSNSEWMMKGTTLETVGYTQRLTRMGMGKDPRLQRWRMQRNSYRQKQRPANGGSCGRCTSCCERDFVKDAASRAATDMVYDECLGKGQDKHTNPLTELGHRFNGVGNEERLKK